MLPAFGDHNLFEWLQAALPEALDSLPFGVIGMTPDSNVVAYNKAESEGARLPPPPPNGSSGATCSPRSRPAPTTS